MIWLDFIRFIVKSISDYTINIPFILMGYEAKNLKSYIDIRKHEVITMPHPASGRYLKEGENSILENDGLVTCNSYLKFIEKEPICWTGVHP